MARDIPIGNGALTVALDIAGYEGYRKSYPGLRCPSSVLWEETLLPVAVTSPLARRRW